MAKDPWDKNRETIKLVLNNHRPEEYRRAEPDPAAEPQFTCLFCKNPWPCISFELADAGNKELKEGGVRGNMPVTPSAVSEATGKGVVAGRQDF